jgi:hypothetical protein
MKWKNRDRKAPLWLYAVAAVLVVISIASSLVLFYAPEFFTLPIAYFTAAVSAVVIFKAVRWLNRRDDPRRAKRPPDPP